MAAYDTDDIPTAPRTGIEAQRPFRTGRDKPVRKAAGTPCQHCHHPRLEHRWGSRGCRHIRTVSTVYGPILANPCDCQTYEGRP